MLRVRRALPRPARGDGSDRGAPRSPQFGVLMMLHPGIPLPPNFTAARLLERPVRTQYQDVRMTASASTPKVESGRSIQRIELAASWTSPGKGRFRGKSTLSLTSGPDGSQFAYVTYQLPEPASDSLESFLARAVRSYRTPG